MFDYSSFLKDISESSPIGEDVRFNDDFHDIVEEVNKISGTNWENILLKTSNLIISESKDLRLAVYYTYAKCTIEGFIGLAYGLGLMSELINKYQTTIYPEKHIAKRNILKIFKNDIFGAAIDNSKADLNTVNLSLSFLNSIIEKYTQWEIDYDELSALKVKLSNKIEQLKSSQKPQEADLPELKINDQNNNQVNTLMSEIIEPIDQNFNQIHTEQNLSTATSSISSQSELQDQLKLVIKYYEKTPKDLYLAMLIRKSTKWNEIIGYPIADQQKITKLNSPRKDLISRINTAYTQEKWENVIEFAEEFFGENANHLWFDLQYMEYHSMVKLGRIKDYELDYIFAPLKMLINKFPDLPYYSYSNGTPFATDETLNWLWQLAKAKSSKLSKVQDSEADITDNAFITKAQELYTTQGSYKAVEYLQSNLGQSIFDNFQIYFQIAQFAHQDQKDELVKYCLNEIIYIYKILSNKK